MHTHAALIEEAQQHLKDKNFSTARALFTKAAFLQNLDLSALSLQAQNLMEIGDVKASLQLFLQLLEANPADLDTLFGLAQGALFLEQLDDAQTYLLALFQMEPEHPKALALQGLVHEAKGARKQAISCLSQASQSTPAPFIASYNLGRILFEGGAVPDAIESLISALEISPEDPDTHYLLGLSFRKQGLYDEATHHLEQAVKALPEDADLHMLLASLYCETFRLELASKALNTSLALCDSAPAMLERAAAVCAQSGLFDLGLPFLEQLLESQPDDVRLLHNISLFYVMLGDFDQSESCVSRSIALAPDNWEGHFLLGNLFRSIELFDEAVEAYRRSASLASGSRDEFQPLGNLAVALMEAQLAAEEMADDELPAPSRQESMKEVIDLLERVVKLAPPKEVRFHYNLALAYAKIELNRKSSALLEQILKSSPPGSELFEMAHNTREYLLSKAPSLRARQRRRLKPS